MGVRLVNINAFSLAFFHHPTPFRILNLNVISTLNYRQVRMRDFAAFIFISWIIVATGHRHTYDSGLLKQKERETHVSSIDVESLSSSTRRRIPKLNTNFSSLSSELKQLSNCHTRN